MAGMSKNDEAPACKPVVLALARFLEEVKAEDVVVLDISARSGFADYFVIAGANSHGQLRGFTRQADEELMKHGVHPRGARRNLADDETWVLLDCDDFIIHLMLKPARDFYALEKLWFDCPRIDPATGEVMAGA